MEPDTGVTTMTLGDKLRQMRHEAGLTQMELARRSGLSVNAILGYERGATVPLLGNLLRLTRILGVSFDEFEDCRIPDDGRQRRKIRA